LHNSNQINGENLKKIRCESSRNVRAKYREYLKKNNMLEKNSKNKNIEDLYKGSNEFQNGYQLRTN
jgi:hypothetical protein